jgi:hypothetical protein
MIEVSNTDMPARGLAADDLGAILKQSGIRTYFGEAFFRDALPGAPDLRAASDAARRTIRRREREENVRASQPQSHFGPLIESKLEELRSGAQSGR